MILYNVTVTVDASIQEEWMRWMKEIHLADVMATGMFENYRFGRLLGYPDQITYTIQYSCKDMATYERYQAEFAPNLQADGRNRFGDKSLIFRSLMEVIEVG